MSDAPGRLIASRVTPARRPSRSRAARSSDTACREAATARSTTRSTSRRVSRRCTPARAATTTHARSMRASRRVKPCAASSGSWRRSSTAISSPITPVVSPSTVDIEALPGHARRARSHRGTLKMQVTTLVGLDTPYVESPRWVSGERSQPSDALARAYPRHRVASRTAGRTPPLGVGRRLRRALMRTARPCLR